MEETAVVAGAAGGARGTAVDGGRPVSYAAELLLLLLPSAHLLFLPVGGAVATGADLIIVVLLLVWAVDLVGGGRAGKMMGVEDDGDEPGLPERRFVVGAGLLVLFGGYVALSGTWGFHDHYALAKGLGTMALAAAAVALAFSGISWERAVDAWLGGTAVALVLTLALALVGPEILRSRVLYDQGGVLGLPFARISGPLLHPNMLGDYLVVSAVLLWARWPSLSPRAGLWAALLGVAMAVALFLSASTAWVAAGIAAAWLARWSGKHGGAEVEGPDWWIPVVRVGGIALAGATLVALLVPLSLSLGPVDLSTSGIRPDIWRSAAAAVLDAPLFGVGASPYVAEAVDPFRGGGAVLWDAHNAYLSVLGQFGVVGTALLAAGLVLLVRGGLARVHEPRVRLALLMALAVVAVNAVFMASEDLRHVWVLLGMCGVAGRVEE